MTFTFTLDAFPDYTKFNKTQKVFADIQVITEKVESYEDEREACVLFSAEAMGGARMTYDNDGTETLVKITAEGSSVLGRTTVAEDVDNPIVSYDKNIFGDLTDKGDFVQGVIHFNDLDDSKLYKVTQTNPALKTTSDNTDIQNSGVKQEEVAGAKLRDGYPILLGTAPGLVNITVVDKTTNKVMKTVQITNKINFKKSAKVTITDDDPQLITEKRVNEGNPVGDIKRVYEGDVICLKLNAAAKVTALNGIVEKEVTGNIYMITAKAADILTITIVAE